jgi:hypothetical protein
MSEGTQLTFYIPCVLKLGFEGGRLSHAAHSNGVICMGNP